MSGKNPEVEHEREQAHEQIRACKARSVVIQPVTFYFLFFLCVIFEGFTGWKTSQFYGFFLCV